MEYAVAVVTLAGVVGFIFGLGQVTASMGERYCVAAASGVVVVACMLWMWGYFCGLPTTEDNEDESEKTNDLPQGREIK